MYPVDSIEMPPVTEYPPGLPGLSYTHNCMDGMKEIVGQSMNKSCSADRCTETITNTTLLRQLRAAYYAAVTFTDTALGRVLTALDEEGLANNTIITLIGDHGYSNGGNRALFCKRSQFENGVHIPM
jgi:membrane-anchored protein YejM (alkaline phosphatase superfamily)